MHLKSKKWKNIHWGKSDIFCVNTVFNVTPDEPINYLSIYIVEIMSGRIRIVFD